MVLRRVVQALVLGGAMLWVLWDPPGPTLTHPPAYHLRSPPRTPRAPSQAWPREDPKSGPRGTAGSGRQGAMRTRARGGVPGILPLPVPTRYTQPLVPPVRTSPPHRTGHPSPPRYCTFGRSQGDPRGVIAQCGIARSRTHRLTPGPAAPLGRLVGGLAAMLDRARMPSISEP